ncbi:hypothetical protein NAS2_0719 [Conexivisphaera calida]|uniref:Uncharacterized protein n=1 Tax=Conexivisphaera calida TaxID=1874277 RepID=A0A4P2VM07_9ARCH|nr:hypothetical protein NAS2_0719 [Conexivisphaera calida]
MSAFPVSPPLFFDLALLVPAARASGPPIPTSAGAAKINTEPGGRSDRGWSLIPPSTCSGGYSPDPGVEP